MRLCNGGVKPVQFIVKNLIFDGFTEAKKVEEGRGKRTKTLSSGGAKDRSFTEHSSKISIIENNIV